MNKNLKDAIDWQLRNAYQGYSPNVDPIKLSAKFEGSPNEAYHIFDCQSLAIHMEKNYFDQVFRVEGFYPQSKVDILALVHEDHEGLMFPFMQVVLANEKHFILGKDSISSVFMLKNEEMILITSTPLIKDSNDHVIWVLEQYRNVTNMVPSRKFTWALQGPSSELLTEKVSKSLSGDCPLTSQELVILAFVGEGASSKHVAEKLFISKHTVDTHRRNILKKLMVENTIEAYNKARELGLLA